REKEKGIRRKAFIKRWLPPNFCLFPFTFLLSFAFYLFTFALSFRAILCGTRFERRALVPAAYNISATLFTPLYHDGKFPEDRHFDRNSEGAGRATTRVSVHHNRPQTSAHRRVRLLHCARWP